MSKVLCMPLALLLLVFALYAEEKPDEPELNENTVFLEPERDREAEQRAEIKRLQERRMTGEFAFEVVDQDNRPMPGVKIIFEAKSMKAAFAAALIAKVPFNGSWLDVDRAIITTDAQGVAHTKRVSANHGISARIDKDALNAEYTVAERQNIWSENPNNQGMTAAAQPEATRPGITYIFRVVKHGKPEPLREFEVNRNHPGDGTTWYVDLFGSQWTKETPSGGSWRVDFAITAYRDPSARLVVLQPDGTFGDYDSWRGEWRYEIMPLDGGIIADQGARTSTAPEKGYVGTFSWSCDLSQSGTVNVSRQSWWWRRSGQPDKFIRLETELRVNGFTGAIKCQFHGFVNPTGSPLIILPTRETPESRNWVKWMIDDVKKGLRNDPIGLIPVVPPANQPAP